ncbi:MAG TPA: CoA pyrophosphatase, partial [Kiloniellales bacterium]|nr:CoA pyrophosphatase [Kiloniellales bacterium]
IRHFESLPGPGRRSAPGPGGWKRGDHQLDQLQPPAGTLRPAAVLVPILAKEESGPTLLLTRRNANLRDHAGQVSFPGGRISAEDASPEEAALREAEEEIDLKPRSVRLIGRLDTYVTGTGFEIIPVVGLVTPPLNLKIDPREVEEVFEVPLAFILRAENRQLMSREFNGRRRHFYAYPFGDYFIWGATAGMLNNLAEILSTLEWA